MRSLICPVCRATNKDAVICRRCRADLSLLHELDDYRIALVERARGAVAVGDVEGAKDWLAEAERIRPGSDTERVAALVALLERDFAGAWHHYRLAFSPREP